MNYNQTNNSPSAITLLRAFDNWLEESSKKSYVFTSEEQVNLQRLVMILNNQIDMLVEYELKREVK